MAGGLEVFTFSAEVALAAPSSMITDSGNGKNGSDIEPFPSSPSVIKRYKLTENRVGQLLADGTSPRTETQQEGVRQLQTEL